MGLFDRVKNAKQQAQDAMASAGAQQQAAPQEGAPGMPTDMAAQAAYAQKTQKLGAQGVEAPGVILAIRLTGQTDMSGGQETDFDVTITPGGGQPYQTTIRQSMLPAQMEGLSDGKDITVKYDPDDPSQALIYGW
jgi:hypothetical protein